MKIKNYLFYHIETFLGNIKGTLKLNFATYFATLGQYETFREFFFTFVLTPPTFVLTPPSFSSHRQPF
jgi:hypothetical protein